MKKFAAIILMLMINTTLASPALRPASPLEHVAQEAGVGAIVDTPTLFDVSATDLGVMWDGGDGRVYIAFGDSYATTNANPPTTCGPGTAWTGWRGNLVGYSTDTNIADGMTYDLFTDTPNHAAQMIPIPAGALTSIPTSGISVNGAQFIHYMAVSAWNGPTWTTLLSGIAVSYDDGSTWARVGPTWATASGFAQGALTKPGDGYIYLFGTGSGRYHGAKLARVPEGGILRSDLWRYWTGSTWSTLEADAVLVIEAPVGELSVAFNDYFGLWIASYLDVDANAIVMRSSSSLTGPWSVPITIAPQGAEILYGAFIHPWALSSPEVYMMITHWCGYAPHLYRIPLETYDALHPNPNLVFNPQFENATMAPWVVTHGPASSVTLGGPTLGRYLQISDDDGVWHGVKQVIPKVQSQTTYRITARMKTHPSMNNGYMGARRPNYGPILNEIRFGPLLDWTDVTVDINTSTVTSVDLFIGEVVGSGVETWVQIDSVQIRKL